jgi:hypothetical protein
VLCSKIVICVQELVYVQGCGMCCALGSGGKGLVYVQGRDMCCALRVRYNKLW